MLALGGAGAWFGAVGAADVVERMSGTQVARALTEGGHDWAQVSADGLRVTLTGTAPDEVQRFRAVDRASTVVDGRRVVDNISVAPPQAIQPPQFRISLLRNDEGISIIGLAPAALDRRALIAQLRRDTGETLIGDLLETADYPAPEHWAEALRFGLAAAQASARAKISITPAQVQVTAITDGPTEKSRLESALARAKPDNVRLVTDISAPRPVISPFVMRIVNEAGTLRLDACSADSDTARDRILAAARKAGATDPDCTLGLGAPTPTWADAVVAGIEALAALPQATLSYSNADVVLSVPITVPADVFDTAAGRLETTLPPVFSLTATHEQAPSGAMLPAEFTATRTPDGVQLRGRITDERIRDAVESFARARFGQVDSALRVDPDTPGGWSVRVIAALEAMADLRQGSVAVTPDLVRLSGVSGNRAATANAAARLSHRLGAGAQYQLSISYDRRLDPLLGLPSGEECVARLNAVMAQAEIGFDPSSAKIAGDTQPTLDQLATAAQDCEPFRIEVGGHTDAQGSETFNQDLSQKRAAAVLSAMTDAGIATGNMTAGGYGETQPVDSNDTEAGREANRRIEFRLLSDVALPTEDPAPPQVVSGVTQAGVAAPPDVEAADPSSHPRCPDHARHARRHGPPATDDRPPRSSPGRRRNARRRRIDRRASATAGWSAVCHRQCGCRSRPHRAARRHRAPRLTPGLFPHRSPAWIATSSSSPPPPRCFRPFWSAGSPTGWFTA